MHDRDQESLKPLTISLENLPASMARQEALTSYAAQRAKLLLGCYRTGEANDPETYVAAITAILARYPEEVMTKVTHPVTGLPSQSKKGFLPTVKEVFDACEEANEPIIQHALRLKRIKEQLEARQRQDRGEKPTLEQLHERFGKDFGLKAGERPIKTPDDQRAETAAALERQTKEVDAEYAAAGLVKPSRFALSLTARKEMAERDELRERFKTAAE